ncbi:MAG: DNA-3-methyladenine glycosylase 2 family protein [Faecalibacterium sp.]|jgi:N-glycosylase/DNA lyase|nr:DNA-3-methyladenine glycosylase 2 family protein [Faecalibacterium sp.]
MRIKLKDDFDLRKIAESGQCFRWKACQDNTYRIIAAHRVLTAKQLFASGELELDCTQAEFQGFWRDYLDWDTDYKSIRNRVSTKDHFLSAAAEEEQGVRILRQEPWETLITFIISQRKSIPAIKTAVETLSRRAGDRIVGGGEPLFAFPTVGQLRALPPAELAACGLGYRTEYIYDAARSLPEEEKSLYALSRLGDEELFHALTAFKGVGKKVAFCTMLFGFHRLNAFPQDVWVNRILGEHYPQGFDLGRYAPYNGVMQQYMFAYYRAKADARAPQGGR